MNIQARIERYLKRGFQQFDAEILLLMEECASGLFSAFPDRFILVGGATLALLYGSPRVSRDIDLYTTKENSPSSKKIQTIVESRIQPLAEILGLGKLEFQPVKDGGSSKTLVRANQRALFSIDLTRIGGTVLHSEIVQKRIGSENDKNVPVPSPNHLLLQKCETFLNRRFVKARDAFDIDFLRSKGARLDQNLTAHLDDFIQMNELDAEAIRSRIDRIDSKLCTVELRSVLPSALFEDLEKRNFEKLRRSLESVFENWL
jgi:hypothetical protein